MNRTSAFLLFFAFSISFASEAARKSCVVMPSYWLAESFFPDKKNEQAFLNVVPLRAQVEAKGWIIGNWKKFLEARNSAVNVACGALERNEEAYSRCVLQTRKAAGPKYARTMGYRAFLQINPASQLKLVDDSGTKDTVTETDVVDLLTGVKRKSTLIYTEERQLALLVAEAKKALPDSKLEGRELLKEHAEKTCGKKPDNAEFWDRFTCLAALAYVPFISDMYTQVIAGLPDCRD